MSNDFRGSQMLVPPECSSPVLVMLSGKSVSACIRYTLDELISVK